MHEDAARHAAGESPETKGLPGTREGDASLAIWPTMQCARSPTTLEPNFPIANEYRLCGSRSWTCEAAIRPLTMPSEAQRRSSRTLPFQRISPLWELELDVRSRHSPR